MFRRFQLRVLPLIFLPFLLIAGNGEVPATLEDFDSELVAMIIQPDPERKLPWVDGEVMEFNIGWSIFDVATAIMRIDAIEHDGQRAWQFTMTTRTNRFADRLYQVRNTVVSITDPNVSRVLYFSNDQREGNRERDYEVSFQEADSTATYYDRLNDDLHDPVWIFPGSFDPFSITHFVRSLTWDVGDRLIIPTTNGREPFLTDIKITSTETRRFRLGEFETYVLEPDIKDVGGVFRRSKDGGIKFWFTKDKHRYPIRMESSVAVGRFWAELVRVERPHKENLEIEDDRDIPRRRR